MALFNFEANQISITPELKQIKAFKKIADDENKLAYVFHLCDWDSPYAKFTNEEDREQIVREEVLEGKVTKSLEEACKVYRELSQTPSIELLQAARKGARSLQKYFSSMEPTAHEKPGKEAKDLMSNLKDVGELLNNLDQWEEIVKKEQDKADTRKGVEITPFNK